MTNITRRQFGKVAATTTALAGVSLPEFALRATEAGEPAVSAGLCVGMHDRGLPD